MGKKKGKKIFVETKSGKKELKFDFWALEVLKEDTGKDITQILNEDFDIESGQVKVTSITSILYAALEDNYDNKKACYRDLKMGNLKEYGEKIADAVGLLFEGMTEDTE